MVNNKAKLRLFQIEWHLCRLTLTIIILSSVISTLPKQATAVAKVIKTIAKGMEKSPLGAYFCKKHGFYGAYFYKKMPFL